MLVWFAFFSGMRYPLLLLAGDALESFRNFEMRMYNEYQGVQKGKGQKVVHLPFAVEGRNDGKLRATT